MSGATVTLHVERGNGHSGRPAIRGLRRPAPPVELELRVTGEVSPYRRARTYGPPEMCSPAEGGEVEIVAVTLNGKPWAGELTESEAELAEERIFEKAAEQFDDQDPPDPFEDYDGDRYGDEPGAGLWE